VSEVDKDRMLDLLHRITRGGEDVAYIEDAQVGDIVDVL
jgi:hypothetical protein